jgi:hypothetical protein
VTGEACLYAVRIKHLLIDSELRVYFSTTQRKYAIYRDKNGLWIESVEDGVMCKLIYFIVSDDVISMFTEGECNFSDEWTLLNKWEKEG